VIFQGGSPPVTPLEVLEVSAPLKRTPLYDAHLASGARMVAFAGYEAPVQYADGVLKEHLWTRAHAGVFDVSHMGPAFLRLNAPSGDGEADHAAIAAILEPLVSGDIASLKRGQLRYTLLLNNAGGIVDDLIVGRPVLPVARGVLTLVVNGATKEGDFALLQAAAGERATLTRADDRALIAVQGRQAAAVVAAIFPDASEMGFMTHKPAPYDGDHVVVSRCGYTGEDGFEILVKAAQATALWERLLSDPRARPAGLGARDSLRLEAGLPLYGHDIDETTSPLEAGLGFAVAKRRRMDGDLAGLKRVRIGLKVLEGAPAREGAEITDAVGAVVGRVTSGGFSPSLGAPIAMGYVPPALAAPGKHLGVIVRGKRQAAEACALPFVPHRYHRARKVADALHQGT
jgi:aminomethyltransferase